MPAKPVPLPDPANDVEARLFAFKDEVRARYAASGMTVAKMAARDRELEKQQRYGEMLGISEETCRRVMNGTSFPTPPSTRAFLTKGLRLPSEDVERLMLQYGRIESPLPPDGAGPWFRNPGTLTLAVIGVAAVLSSAGFFIAGRSANAKDATYDAWVKETNAACKADLGNAKRYETVLTGAFTGTSSPADIRGVADSIEADVATKPGDAPYPQRIHREDAIQAANEFHDAVQQIRVLADQVAAKGDLLTPLRIVQSDLTDANNRLRAAGATACQ